MFKPLLLIVPIAALIASRPVVAQTIPNVDRQRLTRDLFPPNPQDFFVQGREQLEREIQLLNRRSQQPQENLLKVDSATRCPEEQSRTVLNRTTLRK